MRTIAAVLLATIFLFIALLHVYWVLGGKWGLNAAIPEPWKNRSNFDSQSIGFKVSTLLVALGLSLFCYLFLIQAQLLDSPVPMVYLTYMCYAVIFIFGLRAIGDFNYFGFFKKIKEGTFAEKDSKYFSPLCLFIAILTMIVVFM